MATYSIRDFGRREILMMSAVLAGSGVVFSPKLAAAEAALQRTPDQILGPFYPLRDKGLQGRRLGQLVKFAVHSLLEGGGFEPSVPLWRMAPGPVSAEVREVPAGQLRFAPDSPLEESGFEPSVPLSRKFLPGCCRREIPERLAGVPY